MRLKNPQQNKNNSGEQEYHVYRVYSKNLEANREQQDTYIFGKNLIRSVSASK